MTSEDPGIYNASPRGSQTGVGGFGLEKSGWGLRLVWYRNSLLDSFCFSICLLFVGFGSQTVLDNSKLNGFQMKD